MRILKVFKSLSPLVAVASYVIGYFALFTGHTIPFLIVGVALIGFSLGLLFPLINSNLAMSIKKEKSGSAMALMTAVMFFGQFASPIIIDSLSHFIPGQSVRTPFLIAMFISSILLFFCKKIAPKM